MAGHGFRRQDDVPGFRPRPRSVNPGWPLGAAPHRTACGADVSSVAKDSPKWRNFAIGLRAQMMRICWLVWHLCTAAKPAQNSYNLHDFLISSQVHTSQSVCSAIAAHG